MHILRPPGGFAISLAPNVDLLAKDACKQNAAFETYWADILERLRFTAHLEGVADDRFAKGHRLWAVASDEERGLPRVKDVYSVLGANVRIKVMAIG